VIALGVLFSTLLQTGPQEPCGVERWSVKTLTDIDASKVRAARPVRSTIAALNALPVRCERLGARRIAPLEFTVYEVTGVVVAISPQADGDHHIVLKDPLSPGGETIIAEIVHPDCATGSPYARRLTNAYAHFREVGVNRLLERRVRLTGVAFYDRDHRQIGRSRNCLELHPVLKIEVLQALEQCAAQTAVGRRCRRYAPAGADYCWQHDRNREEK